VKTTKENDDALEDITELATGEYPVIKEGDPPTEVLLNGTLHSVEPGGGKAEGENPDGEKAAFWLSHLETEVSRLHAKWHSIDAEFKAREARITELRDEIKGRDGTIAKLTADLRHGAEALNAADERIASKEADIAGLVTDAKERDRKVDELVKALGGAEDQHRALTETLKVTQAEVARLDASVRREQEAAAGVAKLNEELLADQRQLQGKLQDLEIYINGRHESWSELNAQLADYKDALVGMERTVKARDASVARFDEEKRQLAARILDLERQCSELVGRRKEREAAYDELQQKLAEHFEAMEQLKAEHAKRAAETEQALAKAVNSQKMIESLERGITRRDETLTALGAELEQHKTSVSDLSGAKEKLTKRVEDLEKTLHERTQQAQALREELRASHDQAETLRGQLGERSTQLAASREAMEEKTRLADKLAGQLRTLEKDAADVRGDLARLEEHSAELGQLRSEALADCDRLKAELAAQQELVASLETELRAKQATADLLERNVGRITDLGASLAALDREMDGGPEPRRADIHFPDFVETVAADGAGRPDASQEMLSLDALIGEEAEADVVDVGEPVRKSAAARKLVVMLGDEGVDYPLVKKEMTIGRGHGSDIRIASHFISRIHAKISTNGIATVIEDAGSKNGILVNAERVQRRVLRDGDVVSLGGELNLRFVDAAP
jgi:predicted  nucleic acid-binding Zn-ribbon protein